VLRLDEGQVQVDRPQDQVERREPLLAVVQLPTIAIELLYDDRLVVVVAAPRLGGVVKEQSDLVRAPATR
jgi:hypothetical protein